MDTSKIHALINQLNSRPVLYNKIYKHLTGSIHGGILLSQLMYWYSAVQRPFWKSNTELMLELGFTERELKTAKSHLKNIPFLKSYKRGFENKVWYKVDYDLYFATMKIAVIQIRDIEKKLIEKIQGADTVNSDGTISSLPMEQYRPAKSKNTTENTIYIQENGQSSLILLASNVKSAINTLFSRRDTTQWSDKELQSLKKIVKRKDIKQELQWIEWYYNTDCKYLRRDIATLLNNWTGELDRAIAYHKENKPQKKGGWDKKTTGAIG